MAIWEIMDGCGQAYPTRDVEVFNGMLRSCEWRSDAQSAATLLHQMESLGLARTQMTYNYAMGTYAKLGMIHETMELFQVRSCKPIPRCSPAHAC